MKKDSFLKTVEQKSGEKLSACFQCRKCSNGCPVLYAMDYPPHKMIRLIQMGREKEVFNGNTIWVCATCETCATRCPNDIEIATIMDTLRQMSQKKPLAANKEKMPVFHKVFLNSIRKNGRVFELGMVGQYKLKTGDYFQDARLGLEMFKRGKLKLFPDTIRGTHQVRKIFQEAAMQEESH